MAPAKVNFQLSSFLFLPKHLSILRLSFLLKIPRFILVLSEMEYILIIQNATSKMAGVFSSLFRNKWRHHDITAIVKNHLCVSQLPLFYQRPYFLCICRLKSTLREIWILPIQSTIWGQITLPCQFNFAPNLKLLSTSLCVIFLAVGWVGEVIVGGLWGLFPGRRKQKKPGLNSVKCVSVKRGLILPITQQ